MIAFGIHSLGMACFNPFVGHLLQKTLNLLLLREDTLWDSPGSICGHDHVLVIYQSPTPEKVADVFARFALDGVEVGGLAEVAVRRPGCERWQIIHPKGASHDFGARWFGPEATAIRAAFSERWEVACKDHQAGIAKWIKEIEEGDAPGSPS